MYIKKDLIFFIFTNINLLRREIQLERGKISYFQAFFFLKEKECLYMLVKLNLYNRA